MASEAGKAGRQAGEGTREGVRGRTSGVRTGSTPMSPCLPPRVSLPFPVERRTHRVNTCMRAQILGEIQCRRQHDFLRFASPRLTLRSVGAGGPPQRGYELPCGSTDCLILGRLTLRSQAVSSTALLGRCTGLLGDRSPVMMRCHAAAPTASPSWGKLMHSSAGWGGVCCSSCSAAAAAAAMACMAGRAHDARNMTVPRAAQCCSDGDGIVMGGSWLGHRLTAIQRHLS